MEPSSSSGESIRSIETYATAANHPMPVILKARRVVLLCGLFGVRRSHDRCTPFIAETNRPSDLRQVGGFRRVLRFPPLIKLTATI